MKSFASNPGKFLGYLSSLPKSQDLQQNPLLHNCLCGGAWEKNKGKGLNSRFRWLQGGKEKICREEGVTEGKISVRVGAGSSEDQEKSSL